ncbi:SAM-dependent methyltransferase [Streptomyces sp. ML-6]|uniref:SAM-dependent methyltransferase n=1 Tax=Streptomyces sp. ML-6 TaxID=2982693 RepID=UPI0024BF8586|nr:SAM-dependent methyltransferase [Streptomyces sp. ML-6]MDK0524321.1 SAM-dependent methyltransferase [Streptomyces sp. ML-6]
MNEKNEPEILTGVPHSARVWNYWIGGKDHYPVDQELGDQVIAAYPQARDLARASRAFQARAVRHLAGEAGITQFLDIGTGLPVQNSTHEVAQSVQPKARIVYVDNDPLVLTHARALLTSAPEGMTNYVHADIRDAEKVLQEAGQTLDMTRPVAVMVLSTLGHVEPQAGIDLMRRYMAGVVPGSYLVLCDTVATPQTLAAQEAYASGDTPPYLVRRPEEILASADGMELVEPGFGSISLWRPGPGEGDAEPVDQWGFVARK